MKVGIIQQVECEGLGYLQNFLYSEQIDFKIVRMDKGDALPDVNNFDALIVLGGPMNVYEEKSYPYLKSLNTLIKNFVAENRYYLGFCLGGQILAKALEAEVRKNPVKEIGNFNIRLTEKGVKDPLFKGFEHMFPALEWHGDTFMMPEGSIKLAESGLCPNQAFRFKNAYGLQFHLEVTPEMLERWVEVYRIELNEEGINAMILLEETKSRADNYTKLSKQLFTNFFGLVKN